LGERPFLASGKIVKDYRPLMTYLKLLGDREREALMPTGEYLKEIVSRVGKGRTLGEVLNELAKELRWKINAELALKALREAWGMNVSPEYAVDEIAREMAGWVLEICESLGYLKIR